MKTFFAQIVKAVKARVNKSVMPQSRKNPAFKLNPAPAYWLLSPVHPNEIVKGKPQKS